MVRTLTPDALTSSRLLAGDSKLLWLWEIVLDITESATTAIALVSHQATVTFDGITYYPSPIGSTELTENSEGNLPSISLGVSNVTRELAKYIGPGLMGNPVTLTKVFEEHVADPDAAIVYSFEIRRAELDDEAIVLGLDSRDFFDAQIPQDTYNHLRCRATYKDPESCGYIGDIATCDFTLAGANGCRVHGDDEVANHRPRLHPLLFDAEPALGKREF